MLLTQSQPQEEVDGPDGLGHSILIVLANTNSVESSEAMPMSLFRRQELPWPAHLVWESKLHDAHQRPHIWHPPALKQREGHLKVITTLLQHLVEVHHIFQRAVHPLQVRPGVIGRVNQDHIYRNPKQKGS